MHLVNLCVAWVSCFTASKPELILLDTLGLTDFDLMVDFLQSVRADVVPDQIRKAVLTGTPGQPEKKKTNKQTTLFLLSAAIDACWKTLLCPKCQSLEYEALKYRCCCYYVLIVPEGLALCSYCLQCQALVSWLKSAHPSIVIPSAPTRSQTCQSHLICVLAALDPLALFSLPIIEIIVSTTVAPRGER